MATTTCKFAALNEKDYKDLAAFAVTLCAPVTIFPKHRAIVVPSEAKDVLMRYIEENDLNIVDEVVTAESDNLEELMASPTSDVTLMREIAESYRELARSAKQDLQDALMKQENELARAKAELGNVSAQKDNYYDWWLKSEAAGNKVRKQMLSIAALMTSIASE